MGYHRAGFKIVGVDHEPQPNYPFEFHQSDAIDFIKKFGAQFDVIHASPPCQAYSVAGKACVVTHGKEYPDLVDTTRDALIEVGRPYVVENVPSSPLRPDIILFGYMFNLPLVRQRWFELGGGIWMLNIKMTKPKKSLRAGDFVTVAGNGNSRNRSSSIYYDKPKFWKGNVHDTWAYAMGIDWMTTKELAQAIPPAYTEFIGKEIMKQL